MLSSSLLSCGWELAEIFGEFVWFWVFMAIMVDAYLLPSLLQLSKTTSSFRNIKKGVEKDSIKYLFP
ncbi:MAG: hypothetical protein KME38_10835 [Spirirestis rafaelensis WJT71-NPBG6]|nr:hypothetical protein [Spirirestis rafaelensis WJT71-NPBG6]